MAGFAETFERKEKKYVLNERQYVVLQEALSAHMAVDAYGKTTVTSCYLDTPDYEMIQRSLEKPLYKEKLRVRLYGTSCEDTHSVFVEMKKKYRGIVYKRRLCCSLRAAAAFLQGMPYEQACELYPLSDEKLNADALSWRSRQIAREIRCSIERHDCLDASMLISCERTAWHSLARLGDDADEGDAAEDVRITFDENLAYRAIEEPAGVGLLDALSQPASMRPLAPGRIIMEIKCSKAQPLWLVHALSASNARPASFSKYGTAFMVDSHQMGKASAC